MDEAMVTELAVNSSAMFTTVTRRQCSTLSKRSPWKEHQPGRIVV